MASESLSSLAYHGILHRLLEQALPVESRISESLLAKQLGISRTPVREAIRRLETEGYLYQVPGSGTFVSEPNRNQLIDAYEVRKALECEAAAKAARLMTTKERVELKLLCDNMHGAIEAHRDSGEETMSGEPLRQYLVADLKFHLLLLRAAKNSLALKIVTDSRIRNYAFGDSSHRRDLRHVAWVWLVHARIARAVQRRDGKSARRWMRRHIHASLRDALAAFDEWQTTRAPRMPVPSELSDILEEVVQQQFSRPMRRSAT